MIVSIHQPAYFPWLGYFDKIIQSDIFVYLDTVQFQKNSFQNRNKIRTSKSWIWLTVPVITKNVLFNTPLNKIKIDNKQNWRKKHYQSISMNYRKAIHFKKYNELIEKYYTNEWEYLSDLCFEMLIDFLKILNISTKIIKSSDMQEKNVSKNDLILQICKDLKATTYFSGKCGQDYIDEDSFNKNDINVVFQDYNHPIYNQVYSGFEPNMGIIDLLMNELSSQTIISPQTIKKGYENKKIT